MSVVLIYGVGRSGTTTIYSTIQELMSKHYDDSIDFYYEPFLWRPDVFNGLYGDVSKQFSEVSSLSIIGMYLNQRMPLLINKDAVSILDQLDQYSTDYLRNICIEPENRQAILTKMIRANGRYKVFNRLNKHAKNIFVIRNPIDVINSSIMKFSFYGCDFHCSDYDRFMLNARDIYGREIDNYPVNSEVEKEAFYWYISNRYFLENAPDEMDVLCINYDAYTKNKSAYLEEVASFIEVPIIDSARDLSEKNVGPITSQVNLSGDEFNSLLFYYELYTDLISKFMPQQLVDNDLILKKYSQIKSSVSRNRKYRGKNSLFIRNDLIKAEMQRRKNKGFSKCLNMFKCHVSRES